jgi:hypothetical protein
MIKELADLTIDEMKDGYRFDKDNKKYICNFCGKEFNVGEIYVFEERFFESQIAVSLHIAKEHDSVFKQLITVENKYLNLTENQIGLLELIKNGLSDNEIAKKLELSPSTVRHQKFMFREKAKQARMFLAVYDLALNDNPSCDNLVAIHNSATMVDDRYLTTVEESEKIIKTAFISLSPLKLKAFPAREKKKIIVLKKIMEQFDAEKHYNEKELNRILKSVYEDYPTIRRYLIEYGFMERTNDCKEYWIK